MNCPGVISWHYYRESSSTPETWVQERAVTVAGGMPHVVACDGKRVYRHTEDGRVWRLVRKEVPA